MRVFLTLYNKIGISSLRRNVNIVEHFFSSLHNKLQGKHTIYVSAWEGVLENVDWVFYVILYITCRNSVTIRLFGWLYARNKNTFNYMWSLYMTPLTNCKQLCWTNDQPSPCSSCFARDRAYWIHAELKSFFTICFKHVE